MGLQPILIKPWLRQHPINKVFAMKAYRVDSQMVAGAVDWLRVACARATGNAADWGAFEANEGSLGSSGALVP